jgi:hypothetical protein
LGTRKRLIFLCLTGVIQEIKSSDQFPTTTLFLEPRGKFTIQVNVNSSEANGLKKGDTVKLKADCTGPGHSANEFMSIPARSCRWTADCDGE